jgi:hypothetical protein
LVSVHTPLGQFFKLPQLIEHYKKHQKQEGVSLIEFLRDHYAADHNDADLPEDEKLPFKNITFNSIGYAIVTPVIQSNLLRPVLISKQIVSKDIYIPHQHLGSIFHPPRV